MGLKWGEGSGIKCDTNESAFTLPPGRHDCLLHLVTQCDYAGFTIVVAPKCMCVMQGTLSVQVYAQNS